MNIEIILFHTFGGLGLFIYGMRTMSDGLQNVAGDKLRKILETVSANRVIACITGTVVTALIQSSSATTVMLVGFVNAGLLSLTQAIGVAIGANAVVDKSFEQPGITIAGVPARKISDQGAAAIGWPAKRA